MSSETRSDTITNLVQVRDIIGDTGKYQLIALIVTVFATATSGSISVIMEILAPSVSMYWDWEASNPNRTVFQSTHCIMEDVQEYNTSSDLSNSSSRLIYESPYSDRPLTVEMDLVCERSWLISFANTVLLIGQLISSALTQFSERFGRRKFILIFSAATALFSLCMTFSQDIVMFIVFFFFVGVSSIIPVNLLYIQGVELIPSTKIPYYGTYIKTGVLVGQFIGVSAGWILKDWFHIQLFHTAFLALVAVLCWYVLDSPMWLAVRGKYEIARENLIKMIRRNGRDETLETLKIQQWLIEMKVRCEIQSKAEKGTFKDLFKNKLITVYTLGSVFLLSTASFLNFGMIMNVESFGSGLFMDFTIGNALSIVVLIICALCLVKMSTKNVITCSFICEAAICGLYPIFYGFPVARTVLSVLARAFIPPAHILFHVYVSELYPTSVRSAISGFIMLVSRGVTASSTFTKELGEHYGMYAPFVLFGALSFVSGIIMGFFPDMKRRPLIHTVDEMVARRKEDQKSSVINSTTSPKTETTRF